jgi:uncharacterized protein YdhG (YjbR/CyaY superfamily)
VHWLQRAVLRNGSQVPYFAASKKHIGVFPPIAAEDAVLDAELLPYRGEKSNLRFPLNQPIPYQLIGRIAERLSVQYNTYKWRGGGRSDESSSRIFRRWR